MSRSLSVIIPTYNEVENIEPLCRRLFASMKTAGIETELLVVDDESIGSDKTEEIVKKLSKEYQISMKRRYKKDGRGLSSAVLLGFDAAKYPVLLCMDADLQHEPESVPAVAKPVLDGKVEMTVGSRNVEEGGVGFEWSFFRRLMSQAATLLAIGVSSSTDPMSGFFCISKTAYKRGRDRCNPIGFKIGLEIMARCRCTVRDVPIMFQDRLHGESKLSNKQMVEYVSQLFILYADRYAAVVCPLLFILILLLYFFF